MSTRDDGRYDRLARMEHAISLYRHGAASRPRPRRRSSTLQRLTALALAVALFAFLGLFGLFTVTRSSIAERVIARAVPTMTEEDSLLAIHGADMRTDAKANTGKPVPLPGFPVNVSLPARVVANASPQDIELQYANRAAVWMYEHGLGAFTGSGRQPTKLAGPLFSPTWTIRQALNLLNARSHARFARASLVAGLALVVLAALFCLQVGRYGRLVGLGITGVVGSLAAGLVTLCAWLLIQFNYNSTSSPLGSAAWGMIADVAWALVLIALVAFLCTAGLLIAGLVFARLDRAGTLDARSRPEATEVPGPRTTVGATRRRPLDRLPKPPPRTN